MKRRVISYKLVIKFVGGSEETHFFSSVPRRARDHVARFIAPYVGVDATCDISCYLLFTLS